MALLVATAASPARADGAFPDSMQLFLPADRPHAIVLGTNFGLLTSEDDGATWDWVCEAAIAQSVRLYQVGAPPQDRLYAIGNQGLLSSGDRGCSWQPAARAGVSIYDAFPDPADSARVVALSNLGSDGGFGTLAILESQDGGLGFAAPTWIAPALLGPTGIEIARAKPSRIYVTLFRRDQPGGSQPVLFRRDSAAPADQHLYELLSPLGAGVILLAAVDPVDPDVAYLRVQGKDGESLAIVSGGGASARSVLSVGTMTAFLRRADGTLLVADQAGVIHRSSDGGASFAAWPNPLHARALAEGGPERGHALYAAADNYKDGFAVGVSTDGGAGWKPLLTWDRLRGPVGCLAGRCATAWDTLRSTLGLDAPTGTDAGAGPPQAGCGCRIAAPRGRSSTGTRVACAIGLGLLARVRRRRTRSWI